MPWPMLLRHGMLRGVDTGYFLLLGGIFAVGLLLIISVAWTARLRDRADAEELKAPPAQQIPGFNPDTPAPQYLTELELRDTPAGAVSTDLPDPERESLRAALPDAAVTVNAGYLSGDFVTDRASQWAVLDDARIVWASEGVGTVRELQTLLLALGAHAENRPGLVLIAPELPGGIVELLRVNHVRRTLRVVPVLAGPDDVAALLQHTGQQPLSRAQLLSDWVPGTALGTCRRWVSSASRSWLFD